MSEYLEYGGLEEDTKELRKKVADFFNPSFDVLYTALREAYLQGREDAAQEIEAMKVYPIEIGSGGSENFVVQFIAAALARGKND